MYFNCIYRRGAYLTAAFIKFFGIQVRRIFGQRCLIRQWALTRSFTVSYLFLNAEPNSASWFESANLDLTCRSHSIIVLDYYYLEIMAIHNMS